MEDLGISMDEIVSALAISNRKSVEGAASAREIANAIGLNPGTVQRRIRALVASGTIEAVMAPRANIFGVIQQTPCYRLKGTSNETTGRRRNRQSSPRNIR